VNAGPFSSTLRSDFHHPRAALRAPGARNRVNEIAARTLHFQRTGERVRLPFLATLRRLILKDHNQAHGRASYLEARLLAVLSRPCRQPIHILTASQLSKGPGQGERFVVSDVPPDDVISKRRQSDWFPSSVYRAGAAANSWRIRSMRRAGSNGFARNGTLLGGGTSTHPDMSRTGMPGRSTRIRSRNSTPSIIGIFTSLNTPWIVPGNFRDRYRASSPSSISRR
jgi:hypothetical protein